jgi:hypothetical protein
MLDLGQRLAYAGAHPSASEDESYAAGKDCARRGATTGNCHFRFFGSPELTAAWERGKKDGDTDA